MQQTCLRLSRDCFIAFSSLKMLLLLFFCTVNKSCTLLILTCAVVESCILLNMFLPQLKCVLVNWSILPLPLSINGFGCISCSKWVLCLELLLFGCYWSQDGPCSFVAVKNKVCELKWFFFSCCQLSCFMVFVAVKCFTRISSNVVHAV